MSEADGALGSRCKWRGTNHCACESEGKAGEHVVVAMHAQKRQALDGENEQSDEDAEGAGGDGGKDEKDLATAPRQH